MNAQTHDLRFGGAMLQRGFWLYVWEITIPGGANVYYVGRTGDSASPYAQSPFNRMSEHLGSNENSNVLRRHLKKRGFEPEECQFRLVAHGPIESEAQGDTHRTARHNKRRDRVAAMEKELSLAMGRAGYEMINTVACRKLVDPDAFAVVLAAFAEKLPQLRSLFHRVDPPAGAPSDRPAR